MKGNINMNNILKQEEVYVIKNIETGSYYESDYMFRTDIFRTTKDIDQAKKFIDIELVKELIKLFPNKKLAPVKIKITYEEVEM
jgi:hypothetical protein